MGWLLFTFHQVPRKELRVQSGLHLVDIPSKNVGPNENYMVP
jgi:hypothetical protein